MFLGCFAGLRYVFVVALFVVFARALGSSSSSSFGGFLRFWFCSFLRLFGFDIFLVLRLRCRFLLLCAWRLVLRLVLRSGTGHFEMEC